MEVTGKYKSKMNTDPNGINVCSHSNMGGDPDIGVHKRCYCIPPDTKTNHISYEPENSGPYDFEIQPLTFNNRWRPSEKDPTLHKWEFATDNILDSAYISNLSSANLNLWSVSLNGIYKVTRVKIYSWIKDGHNIEGLEVKIDSKICGTIKGPTVSNKWYEVRCKNPIEGWFIEIG